MDLSAPIIYNSLTLEPPSVSPQAPRSGFEVTDVNFSDVDTDTFLEKRALQDGVDASDIYLGARRVVIQAAVHGTSRGQTWDRLEDFLEAFSPTLAYNADTANLGFLPLQFRQPTIDTATWSDGYIPLQMYLRPVRPPAYSVSRSTTLGESGKGFSIPVSVALVARDPRRYVQTSRSSTISTNAQSAGHRGNYPVFPIVTFAVTATGHSAFNLSVGGFSFTINLSTVSSGSFTIDYAKHTFVDDNNASRFDIVTFASVFSTIAPGGTTQFFMANATGVSAPTLTWREAFV